MGNIFLAKQNQACPKSGKSVSKNTVQAQWDPAASVSQNSVNNSSFTSKTLGNSGSFISKALGNNSSFISEALGNNSSSISNALSNNSSFISKPRVAFGQ